MKLYRLLFVGVVSLSSFVAHAANSEFCVKAIMDLVQVETFSKTDLKSARTLLKSKSHIFSRKTIAALSLYEKEFSKSPWNKLLPEEAVIQVLSDVQGSIRSEELGEFLIQLSKAKKARMSVANAETLLKETLEEFLDIRAPKTQISKRIEEYVAAPNALSLKRAVGEKTLEESKLLLYGKSLKKPSEDSLMGRYMAEAKASSIQRGFPSGVSETSKKGLPKLTVAIDGGDSAKLFEKYFFQAEFLYHLHTPQQGTMHFVHQGREGSYASYKSVFSASRPSSGTMLPLIVLSSREAERVRMYFSLGKINQSLAKTPWSVYGDYVPNGGYECCTHWFGEMPLGDELVKKYRFPGNADDHAGYAASSRPQTRDLRPINVDDIEALSNLRSGDIYGENMAAVFPWKKTLSQEAIQELTKTLVASVWKAPGHMQMWEILGQKTSLDRGEFANPGYVFRVLTGKTTTDRVPVVFIYTTDVSEKISKDFDTQVSAY
ncbi:hypothetical protein GW916_13945 [bacterium]|nr:hypothetical protein [bacterium]